MKFLKKNHRLYSFTLKNMLATRNDFKGAGEARVDHRKMIPRHTARSYSCKLQL